MADRRTPGRYDTGDVAVSGRRMSFQLTPDHSPRDTGLPALSYEPLTPISFLDRAAAAHGDRTAVIDGEKRFTYEQLRSRCMRLAGAVAGLVDQHPVAVLAPNTHVLLEAHFGVPWAGLPLVAINTRLSGAEIAYILTHSRSTALVYDEALEALVMEVVTHLDSSPILVRTGDQYEELLETATPRASTPSDERSVLSINYTSGTTGRPKGVMYHHRGAYLQALAMVAHSGLSPSTVHLWTLPMFHCNGWCFPWAVTAAGGTHVCTSKVDAECMWQVIRDEGVTHLEGAPTVLSMLAHAPEAAPLDGPPVRVATGGAPPTPAILRRMNELGFDVTHLYGLTETLGPVMICDWRPEWDGFPAVDQAWLRSRQGVGTIVSSQVRVIGPDDDDVKADGTSIGEIVLRGNNLMLGYLHDPEATAASAPDGWLRTGDLGVMHPDGYVQLRDRSKDIIVSGGENIASVELERVIDDHPSVLEVAVVAAPDEKWGEVPAAFVTLHPGEKITAAEIIEHVRGQLARFKVPKFVVFADLPKTSTGKVQKTVLRNQIRKRIRWDTDDGR